MYTEFTAGEHTYKLRLTTQGIVALEKSLGYNPLQMFMGIDNDILPKVTDLVAVFHQVLQPFNHGISLDNAYGIIDDFIGSGHTYWELIPVLIQVFQDAGFLPKEDATEPKN